MDSATAASLHWGMSDPDPSSGGGSPDQPAKTRTWWHPLLARLLDHVLATACTVHEEVLVGKLPLRVIPSPLIYPIREGSFLDPARSREFVAGFFISEVRRSPDEIVMPELSKPRIPRRRPLLLVAVAALAAALLAGGGWFAVQMQRAKVQSKAVLGVQRMGGWSFYDCQYAADGSLASTTPAGPRWLRSILGMDFLGTVHGVTLVGGRLIEGFPGAEFFVDHGIPVTDDGLSVLRSLPNLQWLILTGTEVTDSGLMHLEGLRNLRWLWLNETAISDRGLKHLAGLKKLEKLWLDETRVTGTGMKHLSGLANLRLLSLRRTQFDNAGLMHFQGLKRLQSLHLDGTNCDFAAVVNLFRDQQGRDWIDALQTAGYVRQRAEDGTVVSLDFSKTRCGDDDLAVLENLPGVQWLYLNQTQVTDAGLPRVAEIQSLTLLDLTDTAVTDAGLQHLRSLSNLQTLHLKGTQVSAEAVDLWRQSMHRQLRVYLDPNSLMKAIQREDLPKGANPRNPNDPPQTGLPLSPQSLCPIELCI
ncbi:MAG: hypothetical protein GXY83_29940 [Rhodopirellula sp.]|nr:hypothetical protein [Rhodopirellula sp.]